MLREEAVDEAGTEAQYVGHGALYRAWDAVQVRDGLEGASAAAGHGGDGLGSHVGVIVSVRVIEDSQRAVALP